MAEKLHVEIEARGDGLESEYRVTCDCGYKGEWLLYFTLCLGERWDHSAKTGHEPSPKPHTKRKDYADDYTDGDSQG